MEAAVLLVAAAAAEASTHAGASTAGNHGCFGAGTDAPAAATDSHDFWPFLLFLPFSLSPDARDAAAAAASKPQLHADFQS